MSKRRHFSAEARKRMAEAGRDAQLRRWHQRAPFKVEMVEEGGLIFASDGETTYLFYPGQNIPAGFEIDHVEDSYTVFDRNGTKVIQELTKEQAARVAEELARPFTTGATP